ncbi:hypothetical protein [Ralstonia phage phiRSL1]|uniref:Uncharacterized protein n=1 Tax=Ralstonia phage phiRSL1 TaxID=1980924 RepID=B2ZXP4_9CAUD|nr:hypothetical protein RSL1_ORF024 [Ralstonia phage phiRSL1]BAG41469.1 hypothetical protein [Ralstonia phage phiRSL1]
MAKAKEAVKPYNMVLVRESVQGCDEGYVVVAYRSDPTNKVRRRDLPATMYFGSGPSLSVTPKPGHESFMLDTTGKHKSWIDKEELKAEGYSPSEAFVYYRRVPLTKEEQAMVDLFDEILARATLPVDLKERITAYLKEIQEGTVDDPVVSI